MGYFDKELKQKSEKSEVGFPQSFSLNSNNSLVPVFRNNILSNMAENKNNRQDSYLERNKTNE